MPVAVKRIPVLVGTLAVLLAACGGQDVSVVAEPSADPTEDTIGDWYSEGPPPIGEPTPYAELDSPELIPWTGEPPIWDLPPAEMGDIATGVYTVINYRPRDAYEPVRDRCGEVEWNQPLYDLVTGNPQLEECLRPYLEERGVGASALDLFFTTGIVVFALQGEGPVWVARGQDYDMWGSSGFRVTFIFTPDGILDVADHSSVISVEGWPSLGRALDEAHSQPGMQAVRAADPTRGPEIEFQNYGETMYVAAPVRTEYGWSVPFAWEARSCHACSVPILGRFVIDFTAEGSVAGVRFVDLCYLVDFEPQDDSESALVSEDRYGLPGCSLPDRYVG